MPVIILSNRYFIVLSSWRHVVIIGTERRLFLERPDINWNFLIGICLTGTVAHPNLNPNQPPTFLAMRP